MASARVNGIEIAYEISGPSGGRPLLMIHGLGAQLVRWSPAFCDLLERAGYRLIRIDNRDVGLSTHFPEMPVPDLAEVERARSEGRVPEIPYTLADMAADAAQLLDALGMEAAHVLGVSLGGMIAQQMAIDHPRKLLSATIMMSQNGNPAMPGPDPEAMAILATPAPDPASDREGFLAHQVHLNQALGSPDYPTPEEELRELSALAADRAFDPAGSGRQLAAARAIDDLRPALRQLSLPVLVIHGADDPLVSPLNGEDIAASIPGAWFLKVNGMGHDLPPQLFDLFERRSVPIACGRGRDPMGLGRGRRAIFSYTGRFCHADRAPTNRVVCEIGTIFRLEMCHPSRYRLRD